jgi:hypothetical protein
MPRGHEPGLATKILYFDFKDHMTMNVLMIRWWCNTAPYKGNMYIFISFSIASCQKVVPVAQLMA